MHRGKVLEALLVVALVGCQGSHSAPGSAPTVLEECDPARYIPCIQQGVILSLPVSDTGLALTYSSQWVPGGSGQRAWDAGSLGLGGWSISLVQRYDVASQTLVSGNGSWRFADSLALPSGERAVPSYDGAVAYIFDSAGRHVRTVDGRLGTVIVRISYDTIGRLATIHGFMDGQPAHVTVQRGSDGKPRGLVGTDGATTALDVDGSGHLTGITDPAGSTTRLGWDAGGLLVSETDPLGGVARYSYDQSGRLASVTDADGVVQRFERNTLAKGIEIRVSTPLGRHWAYRSESVGGGIRRTFIARDGSTSTETIDARGSRAIKLADGTSLTVGALPSPGWGLAAPTLTHIVETRPDGVTSRREVKYALQPERGLPYVLAGSVTTTVNSQSWVETFDPTRRTTTLVDPARRRSTATYDADGRLLRQSVPGVAPVSYTYNAEGRKASETIGTGRLAGTTRYTYDPKTGQSIVTRPDGSVEKTAVDRNGRTVSVSAGDGSTAVAAYNAARRLVQVQPAGGMSFTLGTSPAGRPTAFVPPIVEADSSAETSSYDADGQLVSIAGLGKRAVNLLYDTAGRVASWTFDQSKGTVSYDARSGLVTQAADPGGVITSYGYAGSLPDRLAWSGPITGSVSVTLDANGRGIAEAVNGASSLSFTYDGSGDVTRVGALSLSRDAASGLVTYTALGSAETSQQFDANDRLIRSTTTAAGRIVLDLRYTRDALGRIKTITETSTGGKSSTTEYRYDRAGRLATVRVNGHLAETDEYDPAGNRVAVLRPDGKLKATYDDRDRTVKWGATQHLWAADGNLTRRVDGAGTMSFTFDDFGVLREATLPDGRAIKYIVDAEGRRVGREVAGKLVAGYLYRLDGSVAAEVDATGKVISRFGYDDLGRLALVERGGVIYRAITDAVGSPRLVIDSRNGAVAEAITYDSWGYVTRDTAPGFIPFGFGGGLRDPHTGLVRLGARDYDPTTGRWTGADPLRFDSGDANLYRYAAGDPVNRSDPTGLAPGPAGLTPPSEKTVIISMTIPRTPPPAPPTPPSPPSPSPQAGSPGSWSCLGGVCPTPDPGPGGCLFGSCSNDPNGFSCIGLYCEEPNGESCWFCSVGDTHLHRGDSQHVDFQAAGEFLAATSPDGKLVIQARQEPVLGGTEVTFNTAVAANVNGDRVGVYAKESSFLKVNGAAVNDSDAPKHRLPHGGTLERHGGLVTIGWPDGSQLTVSRLANTLNYGFVPSATTRPALRGMLAGAGGNTTNEVTGRDGVVLSLSDPAFETKLYRQFGASWRVRQSESLFDYRPGESTATFRNLNIPSRTVTAGTVSSAARAKAEAICRAVGVNTEPTLDDCILDVGETGVPAFAAASAVVAAAGMPPRVEVGSAASAGRPSSGDRYAINIGDAISPDRPAPGAGIITHAGQKQTYSFVARASDVVYLGIGPCEGASPTFDLLKPDNNRLELQIGCHDLGRVTLPEAGTYHIVASADGATARYNFFLHTVPPDQHFSVRLPFTVSPDVPAPASGRITGQGAQQFYDFSASPGTVVHIEGKCDGPNLDIRATSVGDTGRVGYLGLSHVQFDWRLSAGGRYTIQIRSNGYTGNYNFTASQALPQRR